MGAATQGFAAPKNPKARHQLAISKVVIATYHLAESHVPTTTHLTVPKKVVHTTKLTIPTTVAAKNHLATPAEVTTKKATISLPHNYPKLATRNNCHSKAQPPGDELVCVDDQACDSKSGSGCEAACEPIIARRHDLATSTRSNPAGLVKLAAPAKFEATRTTGPKKPPMVPKRYLKLLRPHKRLPNPIKTQGRSVFSPKKPY